MTDTKLIEKLKAWQEHNGHMMPPDKRKLLADTIAALSAQPGPVEAEPTDDDLEEFVETVAHRLWTVCEDAWNEGMAHGANETEEEKVYEEVAEASRIGLEGYIRKFFAGKRLVPAPELAAADEAIPDDNLLHDWWMQVDSLYPCLRFMARKIIEWNRKQSASTTHGGER